MEKIIQLSQSDAEPPIYKQQLAIVSLSFLYEHHSVPPSVLPLAIFSVILLLQSDRDVFRLVCVLIVRVLALES